ncbi:MAG: FAD:protein FMN transferase [Mucilaginibacter sp.]
MLAVQKSLIGNSLTIFRRTARLMGDNFEISVVSNDPLWAGDRIEMAINEIARVEKLLSTFSDDSIINQINRNAGIKPVKVSAEIFNLINRCLQIAELTDGVFDITYSASDKNCMRDINIETGSDTLTKIVTTCSNYKKIEINAAACTVFLNEKDLRIGFGAVSKGYAADRAKYALQMAGVSNGVVNTGGDLITWGSQPDMTPWTVATADPEQQMKPYANVDISNMAIATSGNTEKYASLTGAAYNVDPKNGFLVSDITSVSVLSPTAEFADAMATPVMAMGVNGGLYLINKLNQVGCIIVDDRQRVYTSKDI